MYPRMMRLFAVAAMLLTAGIHAQENATITGTVLDVSGATVANVKVTITNTATDQSRTTVSNSSGLYAFQNLSVGTFNLSVVASGFQRYLKNGIVVNVAQTLKEDVALTVGSESQEIR